jgi:hypothetical protein
MEERSNRKRRGGSLVFPLLLIIIGLLFLLDNLNILPGIDWGALWKLWPIILIALGLEVILGRRVSFGTILLVVFIFFFGGAVLWWSAAAGGGDLRSEQVVWSESGVERADLELNMSAGSLQLAGGEDMSDLLVGDMELVRGADVSANVRVSGDVATGRIASERDFFALPQIFGGRHAKWDLHLNAGVRWEMNVDAGVGEVVLDLSDLLVSDLQLHSGVGSVEVTLPRRGAVGGRIDGGIGNLRIDIPEGAQARLRVDRGLGDVNIGGRFERRGDYYETQGFDTSESYTELEIHVGIGSVTVR